MSPAAPAPAARARTASCDKRALPTITHYAGTRIVAATQSQVEKHLVADTGTDRGGWLVTANLDHLRALAADGSGQLVALLAEADMVVADGMPLVWTARLARRPLPERIAGSDMIRSLAIRVAACGGDVFLLGGQPGAADEAARVLESEGARISGTACPTFGFEHDPGQLEALGATLAAAAPAVVFVALGFPKQDQVIRSLRKAYPAAWYIGVGASIDFVAGYSRRAPSWMQRAGVEWLHRLAQEPVRLGRRYVLHGIPFAIRLTLWALLLRRGIASNPVTEAENG